MNNTRKKTRHYIPRENEIPFAKQCGGDLGCGLLKPIDDFYTKKRSKDGRESYCKICESNRCRTRNSKNTESINEKSRQWRKNNPEKVKAQYVAYMKEHPDFDRQYRLMKKYNMTLEDKKRMAEAQNYICPLCNKEKKLEELVVDHDHKTGKVRGLLCRGCNPLLGRCGDTVEDVKMWSDRAIDYLLKAKCRE